LIHTAYGILLPDPWLYQQALTDALVQDWQGYTNLFASLLDEWREDKFAFKGLYTLGGTSVEEIWDNGNFNLKLIPGSEPDITLKISAGSGPVQVSGDRGQPGSFNINERVSLTFDGENPIILSN